MLVSEMLHQIDEPENVSADRMNEEDRRARAFGLHQHERRGCYWFRLDAGNLLDRLRNSGDRRRLKQRIQMQPTDFKCLPQTSNKVNANQRVAAQLKEIV